MDHRVVAGFFTAIALLLSAGPASAGPCAAQIAEIELSIQKMPDDVGTAPEFLGTRCFAINQRRLLSRAPNTTRKPRSRRPWRRLRLLTRKANATNAPTRSPRPGF